MAVQPYQALSLTPLDSVSTAHPAGGGGGFQYYKMRGVATPGPGYETWVALTAPDFAGAGAPGAIVPGSVVVVDKW